MKINDCINYLLTQAQIKVNQLFREHLSVCRITPAQYSVLYCLWEKDGLFPTQLANLSGLDASTVTGLISRLEEKGFLTRVNNTEDRRSVSVYLTGQGAALKPQVDKIIEACNLEALTEFTAEERERLTEYLERIAKGRD